jgi:hypothetical protein
VSDYISLVGFIALMFIPLYVPIAVTIVGGIRRLRADLASAEPSVSRVRADVRWAHSAGVRRADDRLSRTAATALGGEDALPDFSRPAAEPA